MYKKSFFIVLALLMIVGFSDAAHAGMGKGKGKGGVRPNVEQRINHHDDDKVWVAIGGHDRYTISRYLRREYQQHCPPGLAKKNNGCLPPGQAKKYAIGRPLMGGYTNLPRDLLDLLSPPHGYRYVQVDKDVVLIGEATKQVIDAVTLLSAVGN